MWAYHKYHKLIMNPYFMWTQNVVYIIALYLEVVSNFGAS
jgi:hypothetical protein